MSRPAVLLSLSLLFCWQSFCLADNDQEDFEFFESRIRPLFHEHCSACHGEKKQWSGLRTDSLQSLLQGGDNGPAIVPSDPSSSLLMKAVHRKDGLEMPPDYKLTETQIADLGRWIAAGAHWPASDSSKIISDANDDRWKKHWAFQPIATDYSNLLLSEKVSELRVDLFLDRKRREQGLSDLGQADPRTIIRRLSYDLTGLPPDYDLVHRFEQQPSPDQYAAIVEELLNSPHFGEHMARMWLDVARYSDTKGYVYDREERFHVHATSYRDWVITAFNADLPYDRFLQYQIAADRYVTQEPSHLAAMGFLTLGRRFLGVTHDIIDDRIDVVTRSALGLTVACARCHDHKYDPIPTEDYYSLYGVFHNSTQRQIEILDAAVPSASDESDSRNELRNKQSVLFEALRKSRKEASDRVRSRFAEYLFAQSELHKFPEEGFDQILATTDLIPAFVRRWERYFATVKSDEAHPDQSILRPWFMFSAISPEEFTKASPEISKRIQIDSQIHPWIAERFNEPPESLRVVAEQYGAVFSKVRDKYEKQAGGAAGRLAVDSLSLQSMPFLKFLYEPWSPCEVPDEEIVSIEGFFDSDTCTNLWRLQGEVDRWRINQNPEQRMAVGLFDRQAIVLPRVFKRGVPANRGDIVGLHYLTMFPEGESTAPIAFRAGSGRWELADQITSPLNPLTPRVWVNRLWQHCFGQGIVKSTSDFGLRADAPSHPELLDWLGSELVKNQWSTKSIIRKIVLSRAYQLSSGVGAIDKELISELMEKDPENRFLWRHSPRRLRWEEQCDTILKCSGGLELTPRFSQERRVAGTDGSSRRALYGLVDRQFVPNALRVFDFANPDLSIGRRSETTIPQQALYFLNNTFVANNVRAIAKNSTDSDAFVGSEQSIRTLFETLLQRSPTSTETQLALEFLGSAAQGPTKTPREADPWSYGICKLDLNTSSISDFRAFPHFTGGAWQGGANWPDTTFGWAQITADGGHPGNDLAHSVVRRWTAPKDMIVSIFSLAKHQPDIADGVRFHIFLNETKQLVSAQLKASETQLDVEDIVVGAGDRIHFVVDIGSELNTDQFLWSPIITASNNADLGDPTSTLTAPKLTEEMKSVWDSKQDFRGPEEYQLTPWEQYVHILMCTNEFLFVD